MADITDTLKNILGDDAEDKIKGVVESLSSSENGIGGAGMDGIGDLMQLKNIVESMTMNRSDPRTNLLLSLKPYMRQKRQSSIDSAVRLMGMMNIIRRLG